MEERNIAVSVFVYFDQELVSRLQDIAAHPANTGRFLKVRILLKEYGYDVSKFDAKELLERVNLERLHD